MGSIIEKITEFIKEMLQGWVLDNLETMFTDVNTKVGTIAGEVGQTPSSWNAGIFSMIDNLSDTVMVPIAGMIISAILCYELITMVMDKNNMHEMGSEFFFRYLVKACIAVLLVSYTSDITMAIFDVGNHIVTSAAGVITGSTTLDVTSTLQSMFNSQLSTMGIGELIGLGIETMIVSLCMKIISLLITVMLYGRMIEIYLYVSVAPVPFATLSNREWGGIGSNYIKGLCALAFQGFFIMVCVAIYAVLVSSVAVASNLHTALWSVAAYQKRRIYSSRYALSSIVYCAHCNDIFRRINWNNRGCKSTVWRCLSRVEKDRPSCTARTVKEELLHEVVVRAVNEVITGSSSFIPALQASFERCLGDSNSAAVEGIDAHLLELQQELLKLANAKQNYETLADEIDELRAEKEELLLQEANKEGIRQRIADMMAYLQSEPEEVTEYSEALVRRMIEKITVYDDHFVVEFKSGIEITINE